jgi:hypothetical protein
MSQRKPLQTLGDVLRRDYRRRWKRANPEKVREYYARSVARQVDREWAAKQSVLL